jgi:uncharacterized protein (DUF608 family)
MKAASPSASVTQWATLGVIALMTSALGIAAADSAAYARYVPSEKGLDPAWGKTLTAKGTRKIYSGDELKFIGMPCGGIGAGQIEISGEGFLGTWWIFNENIPSNQAEGRGSNGYHYKRPKPIDKRVENGFAIRITEQGKPSQVLELNRKDFDQLAFVGEYPIATLDYCRSGAKLPVAIQSEVFSPFVPLNVRDSANPVTVLRYTVTNTSDKPVEVALAGWLQNYTFPQRNDQRVTRVIRETTVTSVLHGLEIDPAPAAVTSRPTDAEHNIPIGNGHAQFGELALSVLDSAAQASAYWRSPEAFLDGLRSGNVHGDLMRNSPGYETSIGSICSELTLAPGQTRNVVFLVSWWFPNNRRLGWTGRIYNNWYQSAAEVAAYVGGNFDRLHGQTRLFRDTYFDTTLPYWLANRITMPVSILACDNVVIFQNGRFCSDEGIGFCPGTCGHVFNFVTALARLFPQLERSVRLQQDLDERFGFDPLTGRINFRGHDGPQPDAMHAYASDAQSGYVLKIYREHLNSPDGAFLTSVWPKVKKVIGYQIFQDGAGRGLEPNGVLEGLQTMWDPMWVGPNPYNQSLYLAALRAAEEMARIQGEEALAKRYRGLFESGQHFMNERMWNGRYYVHLYANGSGVFHSTNGVRTPKQEQEFAAGLIESINKGQPHYFVSTACDAQQLFGQTWADQLGLGDILPAERRRSAAASIFEQNWTPDIASVYRLYPPRHRILGVAGEPGLVNGSWQTERRRPFENIHDKDDLWTGLEYQAACDMLSTGLLTEGLTVIRSIHDRYDARKRNPWNEIEGSEHYVRSMHSWNVLLVLTGNTFDGPAGKITFGPRITPADFKAFFSGAEGWGSFTQRFEGSTCKAALELKWGRMRLKEIALATAGHESDATIRLDTQVLPCRTESAGERTQIVLAQEIVLAAGQRLEIQTSRRAK